MNHHSDTQPRLPAGHPDGGEWSPTSGEPGTLDLRDLGDEAYNTHGSFEFPPAPRSADQVLKFWSQVEVPDTLLEAIEVTYAATREGERQRLAAATETKYRVAPRGERNTFDAEFGDMAGMVKHVLDADGEVSACKIRADDLRTIARAAQAHHQAKSLSEAERAKVLGSEVFLNARGGTATTVAGCESRYGLNSETRRFREGGLFRDQTRWVGEQVLAIRSALAQLTDYVGPSEHELHSMVAAEMTAANRSRTTR